MQLQVTKRQELNCVPHSQLETFNEIVSFEVHIEEQ